MEAPENNKTRKAPEKVYFTLIEDGLHCYTEEIPFEREYIEYTRKDAFIEKAATWLDEHKEAVETEDNGIMGWIPDYFIEDFRKYMKGE